MKTLSLIQIPLFVLCSTFFHLAQAATLSGIDPCGLIAPEAVYAAFPVLKTMEKQTIGSNTTCSYLDKFGISALMVSVHRDKGISARAMMENMGEGYMVQDVAELGDEAAMAVSKEIPQYNIPGGMVAELFIKKGGSTLLLAPVRIEVKADGSSFEKFKKMAMNMLDKL